MVIFIHPAFGFLLKVLKNCFITNQNSNPMKNFTKFLQVLTLVILCGGAIAQNMPVGKSVNAPATEITAPGAAATTIYTPPVTDDPPTVLYNNGPAFNSAGTGPGGTNQSILSAPLNTFGYGCQATAGNHVADDFTVPSGATWLISTMEFFAYQTGSTTTSTINGIAVRIWNGRPGDVGSTVVWGDQATNVLASTTFSNIYRVDATNLSNRPMMTVVASTTGLTLPAGTYWVEWTMTGTLGSGPWAPPLVPGTNVTGNAVQSTANSGVYSDLVSPSTGPPFYAQGLPFIVNGTSQADIPTLSEWGLIFLGLSLLVFGTFFILRMKTA